MYNNNNLEELKRHLEEYVNEITDKSKARNQYVCPLCGSGANKHGTGAFTVYKENNKFYCFSCDKHGTIIDLYGYVHNIDTESQDGQREIINALKRKYNINEKDATKDKQNIKKRVDESTRAEEEYKKFEKEEIKKILDVAKDNPNGYLYQRGISFETQKRFGIGLCSNFVHPKQIFENKDNPNFRAYPTPRVIIPTSEYSLLARATRPQDEGENGQYKAIKVGNTRIFNSDALLDESYCFIVEGEIDALSVIECGFNAIGLGSTSMINSLFRDYEINKENVLIIALDNDEAGKKATEKLISEAKRHKQIYIQADENIFSGCKDANELLQKDRTTLRQNLRSERNKALSIDKETFYKWLEEENIVPEKQEAEDNKPAWYKELKISKHGYITKNLQNVVTILQNDENYKDRILFNEFSNMRELKEESTTLTTWTDKVESRIKLEFEKLYNLSISIDTLNHACNNVEVKYHPIRAYLKALSWDGIKRIETIFSDFLGAENNEYTRAVAIVSFVGAVARVFKPGIKFDTTTVLVGKQGIGKSKFINKIAVNPDWFTDSVTTFDGKEFYESIQGKWIIELGEGTAFQKSIKERTKQAIASQQDYYREPYARHPEVRKRQCVFWATTNNYDFLKDETGDRRFYPIDCDTKRAVKSIDTDLNEEYINQCWAEAVTYYKDKTSIYIKDPQILTIAEQEQRNHFEESPMQSDIYNFLEILIPDDWYSMSIESRRIYIKAVQNGEDTTRTLKRTGAYRRDRISVKEILCELYGYELNQDIDRKKSLEISRCLKALGWNPSKKAEWVKNYGTLKIYTKS